MKLLHRMLLAPMVAVICLVVGGQFALFCVRDIADRFEILRDQKFAAARGLERVESGMSTINALLYRTINLIDSSDAKAVEAVRQRISAETDAQIGGIKAVTSKIDVALGKDLDSVVANLMAYRKNALQALTMAESSPGAATTMLASAERNFNASFASLLRVKETVNAEVEQLSQGVLDVSSRARVLVMSITLGAALASAGLAVWLARRMVRRLDHAVHISEAIARGELDVEVPAGDSDEVGRLLVSLETTVGRLSDTLGQIRQATGSIHMASQEIADGSQDLATRTERTAGNLQQTASSVSLLHGSVDQSVSAARRASELARTASVVAARGGELVSQVVVRMQDINASATQIGNIISVIDGIAFQTNILALNAAVEAARAGEQGRGFAVVAGEVRSLAGRSAEAAKQIKSLIGASMEKADSGIRLVQDAGTTMTEIMDVVRRVDVMIADISASVGGQASGIVEVNRAVSHLDEMTQQNSALVEQSAAASESLKEQAHKLNDAVAMFRVRA